MRSTPPAAPSSGPALVRPFPLAGLLLGAALTLLATGLSDADPSPPGERARSKAGADLQSRPRLREGAAIVDQVGSFKAVGDRWAFHPSSGGGSWVGLENLGLERVVRTVTSHSQPLRWKVSGALTEYQGVNYLLIERAILVSEYNSTQKKEESPPAGRPGQENTGRGIATEPAAR